MNSIWASIHYWNNHCAQICFNLSKTILFEWLNDGAKGYLIGLTAGPVVFSAPGIEVRSPATAQLLAMKLSAWRDDIDIADASRLLEEMKGSRDDIWQEVEPHLVPGDELKAQYAFADLWETHHGKD
jgi:hypothetical protein